LPDVELVQGEDALDLKNRFTDFAKCDIGWNALKEDVCGASNYIGDSMRVISTVDESNTE